MITETALAKACRIAGGPSALATSIDVTPQRLHNWHDRGVPADQVLPIYYAVGGAVTPHDLNASAYPDAGYRPAIPKVTKRSKKK